MSRLFEVTMTFDEYQEFTKTTAIYPREMALAYLGLGLTGEAGEVANKIKKLYRDGWDDIEKLREMSKELGDVLWYVSELAAHLGMSLDQIVSANVEKLTKRKRTGTLGGSGDNR